MDQVKDKNGFTIKYGTKVKIVGPVNDSFVEPMEEMLRSKNIYRVSDVITEPSNAGIKVNGWWFNVENVVKVLPNSVTKIAPKKDKEMVFDTDLLEV